MQVFTLNLLRKGIFFFSLLISTQFSFAQITYLVMPQPLQLCDSAQTFNVRLTNTTDSAISPLNLRLDLSYGANEKTGLFFSAPASANEKVSFPAFINNTLPLNVNVSSISAGEVINFSVQVRAGCGVNIGTSTSISAAASLSERNTNAPLASASFQISNNRGALTFPLSDPSWNQTAQRGQLVTRQFIYKNSTISPFSGFISFQSKLAGSVLKDSIVRIILPGGTVITYTDSSIFLLQGITIQPGQQISIEQTVLVTNCITNTNDGSDTVIISTGCFDFESCNKSTFNTYVNKASNPAISVQGNSSMDSYFQCFGDTSYTQRHLSFTNNGSYTRDVNVTFIPATGYITDPSSFSISITGGKRGTIGGSFYRNPSDTIYNPDPSRGALVSYTDRIAPSGGFFLCNDDNYLWSRIINHFTDSLHQIDLDSGETLTISWRDKSCCFDQNIVINGSGGFSTPILGFFSPDCQNVMQQNAVYSGTERNSGIQKLDPFHPMMDGNADKCIVTNDGEIQDFTIRNVAITSPAWIKDNPANWGSFVMDLSMEKGVDLDLSLGGTALVESYDHVACLNCSQSPCTVAKWDTSTSLTPKYRIKFTSPGGDWYGQITSLPVSGNIYKKYRITFDIGNMPGNPQDLTQLMSLFNQMSLNYSLRSECGGGPRTNIFANLFYQNKGCNSGCMMPLSKLDYHVVITCPGCVTPGSNVQAAAFERDTAYLGYVDANNDHIPDSLKLVSGILKTNCTNGDIMVSTQTITLSDGDDNKGGFQLKDLPPGNELDNLYIDYGIDPAFFSLVQNSCQVSLDGQNWNTITTVPVANSKGYTFQVKASDLGISHFDNGAHSTVFFRGNFKVQSDITGDNPVQSYIVLTPHFSDCDSCLSGFNGVAANVGGCNWPDSLAHACDSLSWQPNMGYFCQGGEALTTVYPGPVQHLLDPSPRNVPCDPTIVSIIQVQAGRIDFPGEYRRWRFIEDNDTNFVFRQQIPKGYQVSRIDFDQYSGAGLLASYSLTSVQSGSNRITITGDALFAAVSFKYQDFDSSYAQGLFPYTAKPFVIYDDYLSLIIQVHLTPIDCHTLSSSTAFNTVVFMDTASITPQLKSAYPGAMFVPIPTATMPPIAGNPAATYTMNSWSSPAQFEKPVTKLTGQSIVEANSSSGRYYIPVSIDNTAPTDSAGNPLSGFQIQALSSIDAHFPFLSFTNVSELESKGIKVVAVYENTVDASTANPGNNFYDSISYIASLQQDGQPFIRANTTQKKYTVVLQFTCKTGCDPFLSSCSVPDTLFPACVSDPKYLKMQYGWNCSGYPSSPAAAATTCFVKDLGPVLIKTPAVALDIKTSLGSGSDTVDFCKPFEYIIDLKSCKQGNISILSTNIELPSGFEYIGYSMPNGTTLSVSISGNKVFFGNILAGISGFADTSSGLTIHLRANALANNTMNKIKVFMNGITYCGSSFTRGDSIPVFVKEVLSGLKLTSNHTAQYCKADSSSLITPLIAGGTYTFSGDSSAFVVNGNGTATFIPSNVATGTYTITYTSGDTCIATYKVVVSPLPVAAITSSGGTTICSGQTLTLAATASGGLPAYSFFWSAGHTSDTLHITSAGNYSVKITDANSCSDSKNINVTPGSISVNAGSDKTTCAGTPVTIGAAPQAGITSYTWSASISSVPASIANPTVSPLVTTTYIVTATSGGCVGKDTVVVNVKPVSVFAIIPQGNPTFCQGGNVTLTATLEHFVTGSGTIVSYQWTNNGIPIGGVGTTGQSYTAIAPGQYTANITTSLGCVITPTAVPVTLNKFSGTTPSFTTSNVNLCLPSNNKLTVTNTSPASGYTYSWTFAGGTPSSFTGYAPPVIAYNSAGSFNISLRAVPTGGGCDTTILNKIVVGNDSCCIAYTSAIAAGTVIDASLAPYNGTYNFSGQVKIKGAITLKNGTFNVTPGTAIYVSSQYNSSQLIQADPGQNLQCNIGSLITVQNAVLNITAAKITGGGGLCSDSLWCGIKLDAFSAINLLTQTRIVNGRFVVDSSEVSNSIMGIQMGNVDNTTYTHFKIIGTKFLNNGRSVTFYAVNPNLTNRTLTTATTDYIKNNRFTSSAVKMKKLYARPAYSTAAITLFGGDFRQSPISYNNISNSRYGIIGSAFMAGYPTSSYNFTHNTLANVFEIGIFSDPNVVTIFLNTTVNNNSINVPNALVDTREIQSPNPVYGIYLTGGVPSYLDSNTVFSQAGLSRTDPFLQTKNQIGIYTGFAALKSKLNWNTVRNMRTAMLINDKSSTDRVITSNILIDNIAGMYFAPNPSSAGSNTIKCNTLSKTSNISPGQTFGIRVVTGGWLNTPLGSASAPNGNAFDSTLSLPFNNDGNTFIQYWSYNSKQEKTFRFTGGTRGNNNPTTTIPNANTCLGAPGVSHFRIAVGTGSKQSISIQEMKDSLRNQVGYFADQKFYQTEIINYHLSDSTISDLETYTSTLLNKNQEAYNTLSLFLMKYYRSIGIENKAKIWKDAVVSANPGDPEIIHQGKYFDLVTRISSNYTSYPINRLTVQDSANLADIALSGTTLANTACVYMRMLYPSFVCNDPLYFRSDLSLTKVGSSNAMQSALDSVSVLGNAVPNPASNTTSIGYTIAPNISKASIAIFDIYKNNKLKEYDLDLNILNGELTIDLNDFASGLYTYSLYADGKLVDTKKIVVIK
jgi:hypothetical protein